MRLTAVAIALVGCGSSAEGTRTLELERMSPPQFTSHDVFVGARGDLVVLANRISRDGGATWAPIDARLGTLDRVAIDGAVVSTYAGGLVRWNLDSGEVTPVAAAPAFTTDRSWRVRPDGRFMAFDQIKNSVAFETASGWTLGTFPQHSATEVDPYIFDVASNGTTALAVSGWGVYRSPDGGATWTRLGPLAGAGRVLVALVDGRFLLLGGTFTYRFDASGGLLDQVPGRPAEQGEVAVCSDGAVIARGAISRDAGASWESLLGGGALELNVVRVSCGESYWVLGYSDAWGYRLLRFDPATRTGIAAGNWELAGDPSWSSGGPPIVRDEQGTFYAAGLAWHEGDASWSLRELPARVWGASSALHGFVGTQYLTSIDSGRTWTAPSKIDALGDGAIEAFATDGGLLAATFTGGSANGLDEWHSTVWRSDAAGASWSVAYDGIATRPAGGDDTTGTAHRFVGVRPDGAWVALDATSSDGGATWQDTEVQSNGELAFLTPKGHLITALPNEHWQVYADGGAGGVVETWALRADGMPVAASSVRSVAFDADGYVYLARGAPYVQIWRSKEPVAPQ